MVEIVYLIDVYPVLRTCRETRAWSGKKGGGGGGGLKWRAHHCERKEPGGWREIDIERHRQRARGIYIYIYSEREGEREREEERRHGVREGEGQVEEGDLQKEVKSERERSTI